MACILYSGPQDNAYYGDGCAKYPKRTEKPIGDKGGKVSISLPTRLCDFGLRWFASKLRSQSGQNGQILFISGEQLSLNVAGDSAKTLSVLGNMGVLSMTAASDLCRCGGVPSKYPRFWGRTVFFEKLPSKPPPRISPTWPT